MLETAEGVKRMVDALHGYSDQALIHALKHRGYRVIKAEHVGTVAADEKVSHVSLVKYRDMVQRETYRRLSETIGLHLMRSGFLPVAETLGERTGEVIFRATCTALFDPPQYAAPYPTRNQG